MNWLALPAAAEARRPAEVPAESLWRLVGPAAAAALLGISRLLPETGFGLWVRLAAATLVVLLPGVFVARCLGQRNAAASFAASLTLVGAGLALTFGLGASLDATLVFVLAAGAVAFGSSLVGRELPGARLPGTARVTRGVLALAGLGLGAGLWFAQGAFTGDAFFHLGRIRKLDALGSLSLHNVGEFAHGGLHPGYAFPLWHAWLALVARLAGVDPTSVGMHESSLLAPLALVLVFEMGWAIFRSAGIAVAVLLGQLAIKCFAPGHAGVYPFLWESTVATQLLLPAAVALFFGFVRKPAWPVGVMLGAASLSLALVHPTYALFLAIPLGGYVLARALLTRGADLRNGVLGFAVFGLPMALAFLWLEPVVQQTIPVSPGPKQLAANLYHYRHDLVGWHSLTRYALAPGRIDRNGSVAVGALLLVPLALLARRRRWSALVLGGTVAVLAIELWPLVFPHFSDAVSLSQSRRAAGFIPFAVALAGGAAVVSRYSRALALVGGLVGGIWFQVAYSGDFGLRAPRTEPGWVVWVALYGGIAALVAGGCLAWLRRDSTLVVPRGQRGVTTAFAVSLFVLPVAVHGFSHWGPQTSRDPQALTPGLIRFLQQDVPPRSVVLADLGTSYRATAYAPVYVVAVPPTHAANTRPNELHKRKLAVLRFLAHPTLAVPRHWRAGWVVLTRAQKYRAIEAQGLRPVYADGRFVAFRVHLPPLPLRR